MEPNDLNPLGLPSNSKNRQNQPMEKPKLQPIATTVQTKKKAWYKRAADTFMAEDANSIGSFIVRDIIVPTIRDTIYDIITGGLSMAMYGSTKARSSKKPSGSNGSYISYGSYSSGSTQSQRPSSQRQADRINVDDLIFGMADEAHQVIDALCDRLERYGTVTVQDLYDLIGISAPRTAMYWGWQDLSEARVRKIRDGWLIELPRPQALK